MGVVDRRGSGAETQYTDSPRLRHRELCHDGLELYIRERISDTVGDEASHHELE
jgi:hypothetical protein